MVAARSCGILTTDPADVPGGYFDLDHDQRISAVVGATRRTGSSAPSLASTAGLTNGAGHHKADWQWAVDFNRRSTPIPISFSTALGHTLFLGHTYLRPQLYVDNIFDRKYALKGRSSAAPLRPSRSFQIKLNVGI
jgi:hypothetical protein